MKLHISFDQTDIEKAVDVAKQVCGHAAALHIGSLLLLKYGIQAIERFKESCPTSILVADTKVIDRGKQAVSLIAEAKADWLTVMSGTTRNVIHAACTAAHEVNRYVMLDLLDACSAGQSALEAKNMGADALLLHAPFEEENGLKLLDNWEMVKGNSNLPIFISGRITKEVLEKIKEINPDGIVVGRSITEANNPAQEARVFSEIISG